MAVNERSISEVLQDIVRNIQDIVRSELRLAKIEIQDKANEAKGAGAMVAIAAVTGIYAAFFLLFSIFYALSLVLPNWAAALIVAVAMGAVAGICLQAGMKRLKQLNPTPERTVKTLKENVQWVKQQGK
jgi:uncharacterized membrane protein YqjE